MGKFQSLGLRDISSDEILVPTDVGITGAIQIVSNNIGVYVLLDNGVVKGFGTDAYLGNSYPNYPNSIGDSPVNIDGISTAVKLSATYHIACALLEDTSVRCWGLNNNIFSSGLLWKPTMLQTTPESFARDKRVRTIYCF